tara:strand:- start:227 stop:346 length:120 start_codon:yes stop_codon:yes gene_type:complete
MAERIEQSLFDIFIYDFSRLATGREARLLPVNSPADLDG